MMLNQSQQHQIHWGLTFGRAGWGPSSLWWSWDCCRKAPPAGGVWAPRRSAPAARSGARSWRSPWRSWSPASPSRWRTRSRNSKTPRTDQGQKSETIYMVMVTSVAEDLSDVRWYAAQCGCGCRHRDSSHAVSRLILSAKQKTHWGVRSVWDLIVVWKFRQHKAWSISVNTFILTKGLGQRNVN